MDAAPFSPTVVKAAFRDVTWMHVSRPAVRAAASVTRTLLTEIIEGARAAAAEEGITKLRPRHLVTAIDRNVEVDVANEWYAYSPTFRALDGGVQSAAMPSRGGSARRPKSSAVVGAHRFEPGVRALRSRQARAVPAMVRELAGIAGVFVTGLARDAAMVVREGGVRRFGSVTLVMPGEPAPSQSPETPPRAASAREGDRRTIGTGDVLDATTMQLFGSTIRQRALTEARQAVHTYASA
ncbi:hypothetical protein ACPCIX_26620 [Streptomyces pseudogriseolus]|uniref:hypothetical protein n=1 Tax=Streptomyces TaxID=1883 RepID=UPI001F606799|nr:hypothetical protein [Streptomyces sp. MMS20-AI2-20]MCI4146554.1 hypothetical protein [Streptomyces sp. MMS20-AI2-20]